MELLLWSVISVLPKMKRHLCAYDKRTHRHVCLAGVSLLFKSVGQDAFLFQDPRSAWRVVVLNLGMCSPSGTPKRYPNSCSASVLTGLNYSALVPSLTLESFLLHAGSLILDMENA